MSVSDQKRTSVGALSRDRPSLDPRNRCFALEYLALVHEYINAGVQLVLSRTDLTFMMHAAGQKVKKRRDSDRETSASQLHSLNYCRLQDAKERLDRRR